MKRHSPNRWGWGFHVDLSGNLRDVFPAPKKPADDGRAATPKQHVKKRLHGLTLVTR